MSCCKPHLSEIFFDKLIYIYISTFEFYLGKFDCEEQVITNKGSMILMVAKWFNQMHCAADGPTHGADSIAIYIDGSKKPESCFVGYGVLVEDTNRMPRVFQISWHSCLDESLGLTILDALKGLGDFRIQ